MKTFPSIALVMILLILNSCDNKFPQEDLTPETTTINNLNASANFDWSNTTKTKLSIFTKDNANNPVANVKVSVWTNTEDENGFEITNGVTNSQGELSFNYDFEADMTDVVLKTDFIGFIPEVKVPIENGNVYYTFGGKVSNKARAGSKNNTVNKKVSNTLQRKFNANIKINYIGGYNGNGVPNYLEDEGDYVSGDFLNDINAALPENRPVPEYHPEYLTGVNEQNLVILDKADVWVTFVSEGAGYRNVLAYYTYDRDFPPKTAADITECTVIFPNASFEYSGGGLRSGDKVYLGTFEKNTVVGWVLMRDGWHGPSQEVREGRGLLYSNLELNPEENIEHRQHSVLLLDKERDVILIAFEDLIRPYGDNDFNDAVFYASANPIENVEIENIQISNPDPVDTDDDGVFDSFDDYPEDPERAFNNYYPNSTNFGSLAYEDLWPSTGDYDFNDLIIDYNFNRITNADNNVVALEGKFIVRAIGANYENGFGFTIDGINPSLVESVTGTEYTEGYIQNNANGTEANQSDATIIVFDNAKKHGFANTRQDQIFQQADTLKVNIKLTTPVNQDAFGVAPYNPFIIINKERGKEVHLANYKPSDLADTSIFGDAADDTKPNSGKYYKTVDNLPWAINFPSKFEYPIENASIDTAHLNFISWVLSDGFEYKDWYKNNVNYRNSSNIYSE
ncbi:LruC domain-containing protein [Polaribacter sp.]|uniref:LruC domain-containing protein n=1 Tax=Polaribacter sp. TaxID=1920175 RepID=UPI003F6D8A1A